MGSCEDAKPAKSMQHVYDYCFFRIVVDLLFSPPPSAFDLYPFASLPQRTPDSMLSFFPDLHQIYLTNLYTLEAREVKNLYYYSYEFYEFAVRIQYEFVHLNLTIESWLHAELTSCPYLAWGSIPWIRSHSPYGPASCVITMKQVALLRRQRHHRVPTESQEL